MSTNVILYIENLYNDLEFWYPYYRLKEAGATVTVAGPEAGGEYLSKQKLGCKADVAWADVDPATVDAIVVPGGYAPDIMRRNEHALKLVRAVFDAGKPVAQICHAGWVLISAGVLKGKKGTSYFAIKDDMVNAGMEWIDAPVVVDGNLISSRMPSDLPDFMKAILEKLGLR